MNTFKTSIPRSLALVFAVLAIGLACLCNPLGLISPTLTAPTSIPPAPVLATPNGLGLNSSGPWLLMSTGNGLWATNSDGSGLTQVTQGEFWQSDLYAAVQPGGKLVAVLSSQGDYYHGLTLNIVSLPDTRIVESIPLTTSTTEPGAGAMPGDTSIEAVRAIADTTSLAWSPDGTKLAFIGVLDGPTAEVYLYDTTTGSTRRVSTDDAQDFWPSWSPDGSHILYFGAEVFGTGAGYSMRGVWSAREDGTDVTLLYETDSSGEELVGWRDNETAVLASWNPVCGSGDLRLFNISTASKVTLEEGCFTSAAAGSWAGAPTSGVVFGTDTGVYLLASDSQDLVKIDDRLVRSIRWDPIGYNFIITFTDGAMTTRPPDGTMCPSDEIMCQDSPATAQDVTMFGLIWAWTNATGEMPGVWIGGPGIDLGQIFTGPAYAPIWDTNDNTLFFFSDGELGTQLYRASFDAYYSDSTPVSDLSGSVREVVWVEME